MDALCPAPCQQAGEEVFGCLRVFSDLAWERQKQVCCFCLYTTSPNSAPSSICKQECLRNMVQLQSQEKKEIGFCGNLGVLWKSRSFSHAFQVYFKRTRP
jgi:hypothetical protein